MHFDLQMGASQSGHFQLAHAEQTIRYKRKVTQLQIQGECSGSLPPQEKKIAYAALDIKSSDAYSRAKYLR